MHQGKPPFALSLSKGVLLPVRFPCFKIAGLPPAVLMFMFLLFWLSLLRIRRNTLRYSAYGLCYLARLAPEARILVLLDSGQKLLN